MSSRIALADSAMHGIGARARVGAQAAQHFVAVEVGQLQVDQDEVGPQRAARARRPPHRSARRRSPGRRRLCDELFDEQHVDVVVLDVEDRSGALAGAPRAPSDPGRDAAAPARSTASSVALARRQGHVEDRAAPGLALRPRSVPPMPSTSALTIVRPMPVPSMPSLSTPKRLNGSNRLRDLLGAQAAAGVAHRQRRPRPPRRATRPAPCRPAGCT